MLAYIIALLLAGTNQFAIIKCKWHLFQRKRTINFFLFRHGFLFWQFEYWNLAWQLLAGLFACQFQFYCLVAISICTSLSLSGVCVTEPRLLGQAC